MPHLPGHSISASTYTNHGCRCANCLAAVREVNRRYRQRHPEKEQDRLERTREMRRIGWWT